MCVLLELAEQQEDTQMQSWQRLQHMTHHLASAGELIMLSGNKNLPMLDYFRLEDGDYKHTCLATTCFLFLTHTNVPHTNPTLLFFTLKRVQSHALTTLVPAGNQDLP